MINRSILFDLASAKGSETRDGVATVTVELTYKPDELFSETKTTHLTREAAFELYTALKEVLCL